MYGNWDQISHTIMFMMNSFQSLNLMNYELYLRNRIIILITLKFYFFKPESTTEEGFGSSGQGKTDAPASTVRKYWFNVWLVYDLLVWYFHVFDWHNTICYAVCLLFRYQLNNLLLWYQSAERWGKNTSLNGFGVHKFNDAIVKPGLINYRLLESKSE